MPRQLGRGAKTVSTSVDDDFFPVPPDRDSTMIELARERLRSQQRIERNTFWTMVAVAAHTGYGVIRDPPRIEPAEAAIRFASFLAGLL